MLNKLIACMEEAKKGSTEEKLKLFLSISEKTMAMLVALQSQNRMLEERLKKVEFLNNPAPTSPLNLTPPPPPVAGRRDNTKSIRWEIMGELKELFKKRDEIGKNQRK